MGWSDFTVTKSSVGFSSSSADHFTDEKGYFFSDIINYYLVTWRLWLSAQWRQTVSHNTSDLNLPHVNVCLPPSGFRRGYNQSYLVWENPWHITTPRAADCFFPVSTWDAWGMTHLSKIELCPERRSVQLETPIAGENKKKKDEFAQLSTLNLRPVFLKMIDGGKESVVLIKDVTLLTFHICFLCSTVASAHTQTHSSRKMTQECDSLNFTFTQSHSWTTPLFWHHTASYWWLTRWS